MRDDVFGESVLTRQTTQQPLPVDVWESCNRTDDGETTKDKGN